MDGATELMTLDEEPITLGVKRTEGVLVPVLARVLASVVVTSLSQDSEDSEMTVVASVVDESSEVEETDSVSGSGSER